MPIMTSVDELPGAMPLYGIDEKERALRWNWRTRAWENGKTIDGRPQKTKCLGDLMGGDHAVMTAETCHAVLELEEKHGEILVSFSLERASTVEVSLLFFPAGRMGDNPSLLRDDHFDFPSWFQLRPFTRDMAKVWTVMRS